MAKLYLFVCFALLICTCIKAQIEKIDPERPDQTESADLIAKNVFQAEFGFNKENSIGKNYDLLYPTALFKYGLGKIELRMETVVRSSYEHLIPNTRKVSGIDPITLGFKINLVKERKFFPKTSLISSFGIPAFSSKAFRSDHIAPSIKLVMINTFSNHADLSYNIGAEWDPKRTPQRLPARSPLGGTDNRTGTRRGRTAVLPSYFSSTGAPLGAMSALGSR